MASAAGARPLPKFGEWDVNNTGGDQGFTVIFNKARNQKRTSGSAAGGSINGSSASSAHGSATPASGPPPPSQHAMNRDDAAHRHGHNHGPRQGHGHGPSDNHGRIKIIESQGHSQPPHPVPGYYHNPPNHNNSKPNPPKNRWLCCIYGSET